MSELVENMLNLAKMDLGLQPKRDDIDICNLLVQTTEEFKPQLGAKGQRLTIEKAAPDTKVRGDAFQLSQVFHNLIGNAIKYTPNGGAIDLSLEEENDFVTIKVHDSGYGIPASDLPHIFERFYRVRNNGHDDIEGNGLGLAIVKSIIEQHGGSVSVESEVGNGSCFTISLPLALFAEV
jgi:signal transduction histidine kinase